MAVSKVFLMLVSASACLCTWTLVFTLSNEPDPVVLWRPGARWTTIIIDRRHNIIYTSNKMEPVLVSAREISADVGVNINIQRTAMKFQGTVSSTPNNSVYSVNTPLSQAQTSQRETEVVKKTVPSASVTGNQGYVLALRYNDQQTASLQNLLSLQCWASQLKMRVVEPFMTQSSFETPAHVEETNLGSFVRFSDIYNTTQWDMHYLQPHSFPQLASWEDFVANAPRDVILVRHNNNTSLNTCAYKPGNTTRRPLRLFQNYGFTVIREACLPLDNSVPMTIEEVNRLILGDSLLTNVTVIFSLWRGISSESEAFQIKTIKVKGVECSRHALLPKTAKLQLMESDVISRDADRFIRYVLNGSEYIAVMVRVEFMIRKSKTFSGVVDSLQQLQEEWKRVKRERNIHSTFLAWDVGTFGSMFFRDYRNPSKVDSFNVTESIDSFFKALYGDSMTMNEWETLFVDISGRTNPGYIAMLQKTVAARGRCLILAGGGSFQRHALVMYRKLHPNAADRCHIELNY